MTSDGDPAESEASLRAAIDEALVELPGEDRPQAGQPVDSRWLAIGLRLGLERPERARDLLARLAGRGARRTAPAAGSGEAEAGPREPGAVPEPGAPEDAQPAGTAPPVASLLLARSAAMPLAERTRLGPEAVFGWAGRLTAAEILALGQVVLDMVEEGASPDAGRGFAIAWDAGVRLPRHELEAMFREFTELEVTIGSVLAGRDLRTSAPGRRPSGLGALLQPFLPRVAPAEAEAAAALERRGVQAERGLVAAWNAWLAMRYRALVPTPVFDLLVRAWVSVVGPLPEE